MKKMTEEAMELLQAIAGEDRPFVPPAIPAAMPDLDYDDERWDGLS
jgi:hypothetical protein